MVFGLRIYRFFDLANIHYAAGNVDGEVAEVILSRNSA
jgi:hypothetical protein